VNKQEIIMEVLIIATRNCNHRPILEEQLRELGVPFTVRFLDDNPELIEEFNFHHSPNLVIDGEVIFRTAPERSLPTGTELKRWFTRYGLER
jgi:predicted thioredoxin/glutaredoxin